VRDKHRRRVRPSVCLSVTRCYWFKMNDRRITQFSPPGNEDPKYQRQKQSWMCRFKRCSYRALRKVTHARKRNAWADRDELLHWCRGPRRNHVCRFVLRSLTGFLRGGGSNFGFLLWLASSPLQHSRTTVRVCDLEWPLKVTSGTINSFIVCISKGNTNNARHMWAIISTVVLDRQDCYVMRSATC